jgi:hypothetical protein
MAAALDFLLSIADSTHARDSFYCLLIAAC